MVKASYKQKDDSYKQCGNGEEELDIEVEGGGNRLVGGPLVGQN